LSIGLVSAIEESVDGGWNLASGSNADEDMEPEETASPSDAEEDDEEPGTEATPSDATPSEAEPGDGGQDQEEGDSSGELEWDPIPEFEQDEHVVFEMKPLYLDTNASTWNLLKGVNAHDQDGNGLEVTLAEGEGNFYKASTDYEEARSMNDSADGELATLRKGGYYEIVQAWDAVDECMNKAARIIYVGSPEDFTQDKIPGVATGSDAMLDDMELATGSNALKNITFEMETLYLSPTADTENLELIRGVKAVDEDGNELPVYLLDKGTFAEAYVGPGSKTIQTANVENKPEGQTLVEGSYYVTVAAENPIDGALAVEKRNVVVGKYLNTVAEGSAFTLTYPGGDIIGYNSMTGAYADVISRNETGDYVLKFLTDYVETAGEELFTVLLPRDNKLITSIRITGEEGVVYSIYSREVELYRRTVFDNICVTPVQSSVVIYANHNYIEWGENADGSENIAIYGYGKSLIANPDSDTAEVVIKGKIRQVNCANTSTQRGKVDIIGNGTESQIYILNINAPADGGLLDVNVQGVLMENFSCSVGTTTAEINVNMRDVICSSANTAGSAVNGTLSLAGDIKLGNNTSYDPIPNWGTIQIVDDCSMPSCVPTSSSMVIKIKENVTLTLTNPTSNGTLIRTGIQLNGNSGVKVSGTKKSILSFTSIESIGEGNFIEAEKWGAAANTKFFIDNSATVTGQPIEVRGELSDGTKIGNIPNVLLEQFYLSPNLGCYLQYIYNEGITVKQYKVLLEHSDNNKDGAENLAEIMQKIKDYGETGECTITFLTAYNISTSELSTLKRLTTPSKINFTSSVKTYILKFPEYEYTDYYEIPTNIAFSNITVDGGSRYSCLRTAGHEITIEEDTDFRLKIIGCNDYQGLYQQSKVIINGGTVSNYITNDTSTSMEVLINGSVEDLKLGDNNFRSKYMNISVGDGVVASASFIKGYEQLSLGIGSKLEIKGGLVCQNGSNFMGLGALLLNGNSILTLSSASEQAIIGSIAVHGEGNELKLVPSNTPRIRIVKGLDGQGEVTGDSKLKLTSHGGTPQIGNKIIQFANPLAAKVSDYHELFDERYELYIDCDSTTGTIFTTGPYQNVRVSGGLSSTNSSLKKIFELIGENTGTYTITFLAPDYTVTDDDIAAMKDNGKYTSSIAYTGTYTISLGDELLPGEKLGDTVTRSININNDIEFPCTTNINNIGINLDTQNVAFLGGGNGMTIGAGTEWKGSYKPGLYGGGLDSATKGGNITIQGGGRLLYNFWRWNG